MSRHHWYMVMIQASRPSSMRVMELKWNHMVSPDVIRRADRAPVRGHGLGFTI